uniref:PGG domain-containing protein n=3 Tax=Aegilops tauschii subsp. strangulata TaxID=200361 RepID=A0A453KVM9_AEGTS
SLTALLPFSLLFLFPPVADAGLRGAPPGHPTTPVKAMRGVKKLMTAVVVLAVCSLFVSFLEEGWVFGAIRVDPSSVFFGRKALEAGGASAWSPSPEASLKRGVAASSIRSPAPPEAGSPALRHGFDSSSNEKRHKEAMADEGEMVAPRAKGRKAIEAENGGASPPPPPPPPPSPSEERATKRVLSTIGCIVSVIVYCNPIIVFWSTRSNMASTAAFCTMTDFISSSLSTGSWLIFAIVQLNGEDGSILGLEAVIANAFGLTLLAVFIIAKLASKNGMSAMVCTGSLFGFVIVIGVCVCFAIDVPVKRDTFAAYQISIVASVLQVISQLIPFRSVWVLRHAPARPPAVRSEHHQHRSRLCNTLASSAVCAQADRREPEPWQVMRNHSNAAVFDR